MRPSGPAARAVSSEVRAELARRDWSHRQLAVATGLSENYINTRLRDEKSFTIDDLDSIADALDMSLKRLLLGAEAANQLRLDETFTAEPSPDRLDQIRRRMSVEAGGRE